MPVEQISALTAVAIAIGGVVVGVVRWMLGRERERNDAMYQTQPVCATHMAAMNKETGVILSEIHKGVARLEAKVEIILQNGHRHMDGD